MWILLGIVLGLVVGSFLATVVVRWPAGRSIGGRSQCDGCGRRLGMADLMPLVSWAAARGRCRACGAAIDPTHPAIELAAAAAGGLAFWAVPGPDGLRLALFAWMLIPIVALDGAHFWIPDRLSLPLVALGLAFGWGPVADRLWGMAAGGGLFLLLAIGYRRLRGREGLGLGDVKLMAALGAWLGWALLPVVLLAASVIGIVMALLDGRRRATVHYVPLGTCLGLSALLVAYLVAATG